MDAKYTASIVILLVSSVLITGCLTPSTPTSTPTPTTTPTPAPTPTLDLEARIKSLESRVDQLSKNNQVLQKKITEINPFTDEQLIPTIPFKIIIKPALGQVEITYEIGMDASWKFEASRGLRDTGTLRIISARGQEEVPYQIFRENNTIALSTDIRHYYSLRLCDKNRVAMMFNGYPDIVRSYEIRLAHWDPIEQLYKW